MPETQHNLTNVDALIASVARLCASDGLAREVAILTFGTPELGQPYDDYDVSLYPVKLHLPIKLFTQIDAEKTQIETTLDSYLEKFIDYSASDRINRFVILPAITDDPEWRQKAQAWLAGDFSNQGRVRSDNIAPLSADGLLFRSQPEINLYYAFKSKGVSFAPLPVFIRGGDQYRRIEPDFVIVRAGLTAVIEVDGDTVHTETPAEAHNRTTMLQSEGVHVERVLASECGSREEAHKTADRILAALDKIKLSR